MSSVSDDQFKSSSNEVHSSSFAPRSSLSDDQYKSSFNEVHPSSFPLRSSLSDDPYKSSPKEFSSLPFPPRTSLSNDPYKSSLTSFSARSSFQDQYDSAKEDVFYIRPKYPSAESLARWKRATLFLNAARRFRYTADSEEHKIDEERTRLSKFKAIAWTVQAASRFQKAGAALKAEVFAKLVQDRNLQFLVNYGGVEGVARSLETDLEKGLPDDPQQIVKRQETFGSNTYPRKPPDGFFVFVRDACKDPTLIILMVCAALSFAFGIKSHGIQEGWYDGASIAFAVMLVVLVTSFSDYRQSLQFLRLNEEKRSILVKVIRGGRRLEISIFRLVVGDVVYLDIGDQVPADGLFVRGHSLSVDESSMTGESELVHVNDKMPYLLSGSKVDDGYGFMLVTGVGMKTEWGRLMAVVGEDKGEETPLQVRLNGVATFIGQIGLIVAVLVFVILVFFYFFGRTEGSNNSGKFRKRHTSSSAVVNSVVDIFTIAVTIVVVAVPEGLPLAVTLTLAYAMKKMMADKALVRRLSACETMGSATAICTDKTGTLTLNQMTVVKAWVGNDMRDPVGELEQSLPKDFWNLLFEGIAQDRTGSVYVPEDGGEPEVKGSPTEKAVLLWGLKNGMDYERMRSLSSILQVETFSSVKKRAAVAVRVSVQGSEKIHVHWKGAAEIVLRESDKLLGEDNSTVAIDGNKRKELLNVIEGMAAKSLRCVAFAYREVDAEEVPTGEQLEVWKIPESHLTLLAILGIKDPCRPGVREAVQQCQAAGIKVRMVTGDSIVTAKAIAAECGILQGDSPGECIDGATFREYSDEERRRELRNITVVARSSPSDKYLMVRTLKELGEVVAVTGDGTNDAPALHEADIGLAMGIQGTEVAKESSDIVILDDNFATVVKVVTWGRSVYLNIQKFIQFQLTVNVAALAINFVAAVSSGDVPLTAVQLLWVNLIMDTLGALALATEPPTNELLQRPPVGRTEPLISNVMFRNIISQSLYQIVVLLTLQFKGVKILRLNGFDAAKINDTVIFNAFVLCQFFNEVNARKPEDLNIFRGLFNNRLFLGILCSTLLLQVIIVEFLNKFASTVKLGWRYWLVSIAIGFLSWPIAFVVKFIPVREKPIFNARLGRRCLSWYSRWRESPQPPESQANQVETF